MRLFIKISFIFLLSIFSTITLAETYYCPNTARYVNTGFNAQEVESLCGKPSQKEDKEEMSNTTQQVEQWFYQPATTLTGNTNVSVRANTNITVIISIANDKVSKITLEGQSVQETTMCGDNRAIKIGDSGNRVISFCGQPGFRNRTTETTPGNQINKISLWIYDYGPYQPKAEFRFVNGILKSIVTR